MKKFKILFAVAFLALVASCDKTESTVYDPNGQTLAFFDGGTSNLEVEIDESGSDTIRVGISGLSNQDRTIKVSVVDSLTTADPENYTIENTDVVVPAGEYFGELIVHGTDNSVTLQPELLVLKLESASGDTTVSKNTHTVSVFQVCPIPPTSFVGDYMITQTTAINPADGVPVFNDQVLTLFTVEGASTKRQFSAVYLEGLGIGQPSMTVSFAFSCGQVIVDSGLDTFLTCDQETNITLGPATTHSTFEPSDDSQFELTLTEYENDGGCGAPTYQVTFLLTKQ